MIITEVAKYVKGWGSGLPETVCGSGSTMNKTENQRKWIPAVVKQFNIKSIADIGAGDRNWIKAIDLGDVEYSAYDLVPRAENVKQFDIIKDVPPKVDLIMCLWVLNHLPIDHCREALKNIKASGSRYLMMTDCERYHVGQPPEIIMDHITMMYCDDPQYQIKLIEL